MENQNYNTAQSSAIEPSKQALKVDSVPNEYVENWPINLHIQVNNSIFGK